MKPDKKELGIALVCVSGVCAIAYGMANNNNAAFLAGLILIIGGYLLIRKKLKDSAKKVQ